MKTEGAGGDAGAGERQGRPPKLAEAILRRSLRSRYRDQQLGDLREAFSGLKDQKGIAEARLWYWRQVLKSVGPNLRLSTKHECVTVHSPLTSGKESI